MANWAAKWYREGAKRVAALSKCVKKGAPHTKMGGRAKGAPLFYLLAPFWMHLDRAAARLAPFWQHLAAELAI